MRGTLCKCKKVTYIGHVGYAVDAVCSGHSMQWMQYTVDTVCSGCSTQWTQYVVDAVHIQIVVYGGRDIVFGAERSNQWTQYAVHSGIVAYGGGDIVFGVKGSNQWMQWMQYTVKEWYMVEGTLSLVQKDQTSGCSTQ